jgi:two-component system chemotaxis response regulator CheB
VGPPLADVSSLTLSAIPIRDVRADRSGRAPDEVSSDMTKRDIVVIGFSAGGLDPLVDIVGALHADLPAALFVVHHFPRHLVSALPGILDRLHTVRASLARDGEPIQPGRIYVGPSDEHLIVNRGFVRLGQEEAEGVHRPAIDVLFGSAASAYGARVIGVLLSGALDDGTAGLAQIREAGGVTIVQEPSEARFAGMGLSALRNLPVDHVVAHSEIPELIARLCAGATVTRGGAASDDIPIRSR